MKVLLTWCATDDEIARVREGLPTDCTVVAPPSSSKMLRYDVTHEDIADLCADVDAVMGWVVPPATWNAVPGLKALAWLHAGCDELDFAMLQKRGVQVCNIRGGNATAIAEHAMALMLGLAKRITERHRWLKKAHWQPTWDPTYMGASLEGKTLAIIGLGTIGTRVARRAKAFDMRVVGVRRRPERGGEHVDALHGPDGLHQALAAADFAIIATPITAETEGFIDAAALDQMKPTAMLINIARGNLVLETPLYEALTEGRLAGYASDVWWTYADTFPPTYHYPIPSRTGLHKLPNVIGTGDQACNVDGVTDNLIAMGTESLAAFAGGEPMPRAIDLELGY